MNTSLTIGGVEIKPGKRATVRLPVGRLISHTDMTMPVHVVHGRRPGPRLFVSAAVHGDEINGIEIIRRLLQLRVINKLSGTLIAVPIVNVFAFINQSRYMPDRRDLNRFFPGSAKGSLTSQLADLFMREVVSKCTHGIDLHTGSNHRTNLAQIRASLNDPATRHMAFSFGAPVVLDTKLRDGSMRQVIRDRGIPVLVYEAGEALRFSDDAIRTGLRGVVSVMRALGMLGVSKSKRFSWIPLAAKGSNWVRTPMSGMLNHHAKLGDMVEENQLLGFVCDPFGETEVKIRAPFPGLIIGMVQLPLVYRGDALYHIATFEDVKIAAESLKVFEKELRDEDLDEE